MDGPAGRSSAIVLVVELVVVLEMSVPIAETPRATTRTICIKNKFSITRARKALRQHATNGITGGIFDFDFGGWDALRAIRVPRMAGPSRG